MPWSQSPKVLAWILLSIMAGLGGLVLAMLFAANG